MISVTSTDKTFLKFGNLTMLSVSIVLIECLICHFIYRFFFLKQPTLNGWECWIKIAKYMSNLIFVSCEVSWEPLQCMVPNKTVELLQLSIRTVFRFYTWELKSWKNVGFLEANHSICIVPLHDSSVTFVSEHIFCNIF